jgi:hypothetical protein
MIFGLTEGVSVLIQAVKNLETFVSRKGVRTQSNVFFMVPLRLCVKSFLLNSDKNVKLSPDSYRGNRRFIVIQKPGT